MEESFQRIHQERRERLIIKAMIGWAKMRFAVAMQYNIPPSLTDAFKILISVEKLKKVAVISDEDAWILEQNAGLFGIIAKQFMRDILPRELYNAFGAPTVMSDRRQRLIDVALMPPTTTHVMNSLPCTSYLVEKKELVKRFKDVNDYVVDNQVDILPMLIRNLDDMLSKEEQNKIHEYYDRFKDDTAVLKLRENIIESRKREEENLNAIQKIINKQGDKTSIAKLAITLHTMVDHAYKTNPHRIQRIKYGKQGAEPEFEFTRLFIVDCGIDLGMVQRIVDPLLPDGLKMLIDGTTVLFTTTQLKPDDTRLDVFKATMIESEEDLNSIFNTFVGPIASVSDVDRIMGKFLQEKYQNYQQGR